VARRAAANWATQMAGEDTIRAVMDNPQPVRRPGADWG